MTARISVRNEAATTSEHYRYAAPYRDAGDDTASEPETESGAFHARIHHERELNRAIRLHLFSNASHLTPGTVIYRIIDPSSGDNSICWMRKEEFDRLKSKSEWRRRFAVWKSWNENGEYVTYTVSPKQPLKVWEGAAATQTKKDAENLTKYSLEGGAMLKVVDPSQLKKSCTGPRQKTGWGYGGGAETPEYSHQGLPSLETKHNWFPPKDK